MDNDSYLKLVKYAKERIGTCDSPYFFSGGVSSGHCDYEPRWTYDKPEPKSKLWQCKYCGSSNFDLVVKCESCNASRPMETSLSSVWGVSPKTTTNLYQVIKNK